MKGHAKTVWICAAALFLGLLAPSLVQRGMFLDGVTYAAISNNLSQGIGSFWAPHYTPTLYPVFVEHPPLVFGIQSLLFGIFGDHFWVEKLYSLLTAVGVVLGIVYCLRQVFERHQASSIAGLAVVLWISIPQVFWSFQNNMLENTTSVFALFSVGAFLAYHKSRKKWWVLLWALFLIAGFLSKGPAALFPLIMPVLLLIVWKKETETKSFLHAYATIIVLGTIFYLSSEGLTGNLFAYLDSQLIPALEGKREITTDNRYGIVGKFFLEGALSFLLLGLALVRKNWKISKETVVFLVLALAASLPLIVSLKQRSYYLVPAFPFLAMAAAVAVSPFVIPWLGQLSGALLKKMNIAGIIAIVGIGIFSVVKFGDYSRNQTSIEDAGILAMTFPKNYVFSTSVDDWDDWGFHAALARAGSQGLDMDRRLEYFLTKSENKVPIGYSKVEVGLKKYFLFRQDVGG